VWKTAALVIAGAICVAGSWWFLKWGMASSAATRASDPDVAAFLVTLGPDDPLTHYLSGALLEKSFDPEDLPQAVHEFEIATSLAPENYLYWLDLGPLLERSGDPVRAEQALRRALEIAPNYSRVHWVLGNLLLRQDRTDEAFAEIDKAVQSDPTFAGPAALAAWTFLEKDLERIRRTVTPSPPFDAALASLLAREKRFDDAIAMWDRIPIEEKRTSVRDAGASLLTALATEKKFRSAIRISTELGDSNSGVKIGEVTNGGFEGPVKPTGAGAFEWQITGGLEPQIVLSNGQKHGGNNSLLLVFNSNDGKEFRSISQLIAVEPNTAYDLEFFYKADLKTLATLKWQIVDAADGKVLAMSDGFANQTDWTSLHVRFTSSAGDGIMIRLVRENCPQVCSATGSLWLDDIALRSSR